MMEAAGRFRFSHGENAVEPCACVQLKGTAASQSSCGFRVQLAPPSPHPLAARVLVSFSVVDDCAWFHPKLLKTEAPHGEAIISRGSCGVGAAARAELKLIEGELRSDEALRLQAEARPADVRPRLPAVVE